MACTLNVLLRNSTVTLLRCFIYCIAQNFDSRKVRPNLTNGAFYKQNFDELTVAFLGSTQRGNVSEENFSKSITIPQNLSDFYLVKDFPYREVTIIDTLNK